MPITLDELLAKAPLITDGAWGTQMQARGLPAGACPDLWNLEQPERVMEVARAYVEVGSKIILTNTFGANAITLKRHQLADKAAEINRAGARISKEAAGDRALVFASMGSSGAMLAMGDIEEEEVEAAFEEQAMALAEGGADALLVETMTELEEAQIAVRAAKKTGLLVGCTMVFDSGAELDRTMMGVSIEQAVEGLTEAGADIIGSNCGVGFEPYNAIVERMVTATDKPVWLKPNAGKPELQDGKTIFPASPEQFTEFAVSLIQRGAKFVGGCCGTTPEFIAALAQKGLT
jgi:methionine synthase I (cobalamin-dependent)